MSLLDTVDPDFIWHKPKSGDPDGDIVEEKLYREATVESLLAENRKQVLLEAAYWFSANICSCPADELRRMTESTMEGEK